MPKRREPARRPCMGVIGTDEDLVVTVRPPLGDAHLPVALTAHAGDVLIKDVDYREDETLVTLRNKLGRPVPYVLIIVPSTYVRLATLPWKDISSHAEKTLVGVWQKAKAVIATARAFGIGKGKKK